MSTQITTQGQNQNVIEIIKANGEKKWGYKSGITGPDRSLMIATYGKFSKDHMTVDEEILFAENAIKDHLNEIENLKNLRYRKMFQRYSPNIDELEQIVALVKEQQQKNSQEKPIEE